MINLTEYNKWNRLKDIKKELLLLDNKEIEDCFYKELEFGTGGIRAKMGPGPNRLNKYTIRKNILGYARYIESFGEKAKRKGIVIAYDNRLNSKEFSLEAARILASCQINVYLFDSLRPTPELSFAIRYLKAFGGIVITASHNPPIYNGVKIYDSQGCQCVPRDTDVIIKYIKNIGSPIDIKIHLFDQTFIKIINEEIDMAYYNELEKVQENPDIKKNISIVYTPLCGAGYLPVTKMFARLGYKYFEVKSQCNFDPIFSTVKSPNPENKEAFDEAIELAQKKNADLVIATDPDCDRLGVVVRHNNQYHYLTGNQTGAILLQYILSEKYKKKTLPKNGIVFNTVVTSNLGKKICDKYNIELESTLTGFKYIGDKINQYKGKKEFLFGYEESYGYLIKDFNRDKDGVQSSILIAEICNFYKNQNKSLIDVLNEIYNEYGYVDDIQENETIEGIDGKQKIENIINNYRYNFVNEINGKKVIYKEDYLLSIKEHYNGKKSKLYLPKSNLIKLILEDESWIAVRPSGNEPKIKYYKDLWR